MSDYQLTAAAVLEAYSITLKGTGISAVTDCAMLSMAMPKGGEGALEQQLRREFGLDVPKMGQWLSSGIDNTRFLRLQDDLCFVQFDYAGDRAVEKFSERISAAYLSDQSDSWVLLRLSGEKSRQALARMCPLDLHPAVFKPGSVARTVMEHIGAIIVCEAENEYLLMALRSYAESFVHALEVSIKNVTGSE